MIPFYTPWKHQKTPGVTWNRLKLCNNESKKLESKILTLISYNQKLPFINWSMDPLKTNVPRHTETSQSIWIVNQLAGFYMIGNISH